MQIFGLDPIVAAIIITAIGVSLSVLLGWLKNKEPFNIRQGIASGVIAFVVSMQLVIAQLSVLPAELPELVVGGIFAGLVAQIAGIDSLAKSAAQAVQKARKSE